MKKLKALSLLVVLGLSLSALPALTAPARANECAAIGCDDVTSIAGSALVGLLTIELTPVASIAASTVFAA